MMHKQVVEQVQEIKTKEVVTKEVVEVEVEREVVRETN